MGWGGVGVRLGVGLGVGVRVGLGVGVGVRGRGRGYLPGHTPPDALELALEHCAPRELASAAVALELGVVTVACAPTHELITFRDVAGELVGLRAVVARIAELARALTHVQVAHAMGRAVGRAQAGRPALMRPRQRRRLRCDSACGRGWRRVAEGGCWLAARVDGGGGGGPDNGRAGVGGGGGSREGRSWWWCCGEAHEKVTHAEAEEEAGGQRRKQLDAAATTSARRGKCLALRLAEPDEVHA